MADVATLLPPNATKLERDLEQAGSARIETMAVPLRTLWNPETCPAALLPWLAWALDVLAWRSDWPEPIQRAAIAASIAVHNHIGTLGGLTRALDALGFGRAVVTEYWGLRHRGGFDHDGAQDHVGLARVYRFDVSMSLLSPISGAMYHKGVIHHDGAQVHAVGPGFSQAAVDLVRAIIDAYKNTRSGLRNLYYAAKFHNGLIARDGATIRDGGLILG